MNQLDLSYYSKKDLPNILVYIELREFGIRYSL